MPHGDLEVALQPLVGRVNNQVHSEWSCGCTTAGKLILNFGEPTLITLAGALIQGWERTDHTAAASLDYKVGARNQKHGSCNRGDGQPVSPRFGQGHGNIIASCEGLSQIPSKGHGEVRYKVRVGNVVVFCGGLRCV